MESQLIVNRVDQNDDGRYRCIAVNYGGENINFYSLDVECKYSKALFGYRYDSSFTNVCLHSLI